MQGGLDGRRRAWACLPDDALAEIAGGLHDAADFVRFHAVCRPWREAAPPPPSFLPCLIAQDGGSSEAPGLLRLHSPFSRKKRHPPPTWALAALRGKMLEISGAAAGRVLALGCSNYYDQTAMLINPLTGDATSLLPLPHRISPGSAWRRTNGIVSSNGAVVFHTRAGHRLAATQLRPGETDWEHLDMACPAELGGNYNTWMDEPTRRAAALWSSGVLPGGARAMAKLPRKPRGDSPNSELLCVDVLDMLPESPQAPAGDTPAAMVSVHALEGRDDGRAPRWVGRGHGGRGIDHMCLFLDWVSSSGFAVDAREFTAGAEVTGGCAYGLGTDQDFTARESVHGVYRYSFKDGTATVVDELPAAFDRTAIWYTPRPRIHQLRSSRRAE
ncbi:hypothetical protein ACP70R_001263 [Stipagrostis hirtigluma subsp. patula]